ncbi:lipase [Chloropicon primus]|uniref:Lipase n=1 Tax=Chloropicon primus TaxID=1764295 RepID=A0A5B8MX90_9CHLO|nr:lipase [Chloropicon primus]UPR03962.1 lipase [Chloropicon primus]|eukprot:QDZ24756.1 lipase [Chloropicon primus]
MVSLVNAVHRFCIYLIVDVYIGIVEEVTKNVCRETVRQFLRFTNSIPAFFVSLVDDKFFWRKMRRTYNRGHGVEGAWRQFWSTTNMKRSSSFNAIFELEHEEPKGEEPKGEGGKGAARKPLKCCEGSEDRRGLWPIPERSGKGLMMKKGGQAAKSSGGYVHQLSSRLKGLMVVPEKLMRQNSLDQLLFQKLDVDVSGIAEDVSVNSQVAIDTYFNFIKSVWRVVLLDFSFVAEKLGMHWSEKEAGPSRQPSSPKQVSVRRSPSLIMLKASMKKKKSKFSIMDTITDAGYPIHKYEVETKDGYLLDLYRIPRPESQDVVMFQHGMMDSAYGWVLKGDESAIAFAAYDRGFDVFLANFRGTPPRKCRPRVKKFWMYTFNELGMYDMRAAIEKIHELKEAERAEMENRKEEDALSSSYKLRVVGHSLGGAALLIYLAAALKQKRDHHIHRMVLLSPAGRHEHSLPLMARILCLMDRVLGPSLKTLNFGMTVYGSVIRVGAQKMAVDVSSLPGLKGLFDILCRILFGGDRSFGDVLAPYWSPYIQSMPGLCWGIVRHGHQIVNGKCFSLYNYGSRAENLKHYGSALPPKVMDAYENVRSVPIDIFAGEKDGVCPPKSVYLQYLELERRGVPVTFKELPGFGHLNFIHQPSEEFTDYLLSRLSLS